MLSEKQIISPLYEQRTLNLGYCNSLGWTLPRFPFPDLVLITDIAFFKRRRWLSYFLSLKFESPCFTPNSGVKMKSSSTQRCVFLLYSTMKRRCSRTHLPCRAALYTSDDRLRSANVKKMALVVLGEVGSPA